MKNDELTTIAARLIQNADSDQEGYTRSDLMDRFMGEPYGDEVDGQSTYVSTDCSDAVEAMLPDVLEPFTSSERIMEFVPVGPEDEDAAEQETDAIHHFFFEKNNGFETLYTWVKEGLIQQNSYVQRGWVTKKRTTVERYEDLTPEQLQQVLYDLGPDDKLTIQEAEGFTETPEGIQLDPPVSIDPETGEPQYAPITIKFKCEKIDKEYEIDCFPQEEFFVTPRWHKLTFDGCPCHGRKRDIEAGELIAMGFDEQSVKEATKKSWDDEDEDARHYTRDNRSSDIEEEEGDASTRKVTVYHAFVRMDIDDDGIAELCEVWATGDGSVILERDGKPAIEEVSHSPFSSWTPYIVPHRHVGRSVVEQVDDIAKVNTVLMRTTLDNIYSTQYTRYVYDPAYATDEFVESLANPQHAGGVPYGGVPGSFQPMTPQSIAPITLPLMEKFADLKEVRTGATRYNQGLDAESLNKTATGVQQIQEAGQKRQKMIARIFAETGLRDLFLGIHRDLRNGGQNIMMKLNNQWAEVNPREWKERTDMRIRVGMGSGDKQEKRAAYMMLQQAMQQFLMDPEFRQSGAIGYEQMYNLANEMGQTFGLMNVNKFMLPPEQLPPPPPPDPQQQAMQQAMQQAQLQQMQMPMMEFQLRQQKQEADIARDMRKIELDAQVRMEELRLKSMSAETQAAKAAADIQTDDERLELDRQKSLREDDFRRDKLEADTLTGYMRDMQARVNSEPPSAADYSR